MFFVDEFDPALDMIRAKVTSVIVTLMANTKQVTATKHAPLIRRNTLTNFFDLANSIPSGQNFVPR